MECLAVSLCRRTGDAPDSCEDRAESWTCEFRRVQLLFHDVVNFLRRSMGDGCFRNHSQQLFRATPLSKPGAARNDAYLPVVEVPVLSDVVFDLDLSLDFLLDLSDDPGVLDIPGEVALPEFVSGAVELPGVVDVPPGVLVPGVVVEPGVVVVLGGVEPGAGVPAPPACANKSEPPRKTPTAGVSSNANFLFMLVSLADVKPLPMK